MGAQYRQDVTHHTELSHTKDRIITLEQMNFGNINELNASVYADELIEVSDRFTINAGVRVDYFRSQYEDLLAQPVTKKHATDAIVSPKLNFYYTLNPRVQLYLNSGKGFHSNDARVVVPQGGLAVLPPAYGSDLGLIVKPFPRLLINAAAWYLWLAQEFVFVGDENVVEPSGRSRRYGVDVSARYQLTNRTNGANLYADVDLNTATPRAIDAEAGPELPAAGPPVYLNGRAVAEKQ